jgi:hypothetical protein
LYTFLGNPSSAVVDSSTAEAARAEFERQHPQIKTVYGVEASTPVAALRTGPTGAACRISREEKFRTTMAQNPTCPDPRLEKFFLVEGAAEGWEIRLHSALFHDIIEGWQRAGLVVLPENHRAIAAGMRGGRAMWGVAATLESKRGISDDLLCALVASGFTVADNKVNDLNLVRWLLQAGQPYGWKVTRAA